MRSRHADRFNHDDEAAEYDEDVTREEHPVRAGYSATLAWVASAAAVGPAARVVDLGCGTGNLSARLPGWGHLTCVDVSRNMLRRAAVKLAGRPGVTFVEGCLLEHAHEVQDASVDRFVSTYAVHHLPEEEKQELFRQLRRALRPGGRAVFGDLMFEDAARREVVLDDLRSGGFAAFVNDLHDEYPWDLGACRRGLEDLGFETTERRFSALSWTLVAELTGKRGAPAT